MDEAYCGALGEEMLSLVWDPSALEHIFPGAGTGHGMCVVAFGAALNSLGTILNTLGAESHILK